VLAFGEGMQADVDPGVLRSLCELYGFARQDLMGAAVDHNRRKAGRISVKHVDPRIVPGHGRAAIHASRNASSAALVTSAAVSALLSNVSFFSSMSHQGETDSMSGFESRSLIDA
jgi:hypothetical protein